MINAQTWPGALLVEAGASAGYSCLVDGELAAAGAKGRGGILFEAPNAQIRFSQFPTAALCQ